MIAGSQKAGPSLSRNGGSIRGFPGLQVCSCELPSFQEPRRGRSVPVGRGPDTGGLISEPAACTWAAPRAGGRASVKAGDLLPPAPVWGWARRVC